VGSVCASVRAAALIVAIATAGVARAQTAAVVPRPPAPAVSVDRATERPLTGTPMAWPRFGPARVVWMGFQMHGDGSRVYLQTTADVEVTVEPSKDGLTVTVHGCRLYVRNGRRPLDTRFFRTPVSSVSLAQRKKDVALLIGLAQPAGDVVPRKEAGPSGSQFWVLDFPPAKEILADAPRPAAH